MSIYIVTGLPGHGKSTYATILATRWQAHYARRRREPRRIIANFRMAVPGVELMESWDDIKDVSNSIVIIDEAPIWFGGYDSHKNQKHMGFFSQHRKEGNSLIVLAQSWASLDPTVRSRTCEGVYEVRRLFGPTIWEEPSFIERRFGWWSVVRRYSSESYEAVTKRKCWSTEFIRLDKWHGKFDTLAKIGRLDEGRNSQGAGLAGSMVVERELKPGDGILTAREYDLARLLSEGKKRGAHKHREPLAAEGARAELTDRVISDFVEYCRGVTVDEMGRVIYGVSMESTIDDLVALRLSKSEGENGRYRYPVGDSHVVHLPGRVGENR